MRLAPGKTFWGVLFVSINVPLVILSISANVANFTMALSAILTIIVNRRFLPKEYRGSAFRELMLVLCILFFGFFFFIFLSHPGGLAKALAGKK